MQHEPDRAVHEVLDEVGRPVAVALEQRARGRGRVDHHRAAGEQAERRREQQPVLERLLPGPGHQTTIRQHGSDASRRRGRSAAHERLEVVAARLEERYWSNDAQAGDSSTTSPGARRRARPRPRAPGRRTRGPARRPAPAPRPAGRAPRRSGTRRARARPAPRRAARSPRALPRPPRITWTPAGERADADDRGRHVRRLGVVDVERRRRPGATSSSRCATPAKVASAGAHRVGGSTPRASVTAAAAIAFSTVVGAAQPDLADADAAARRATRQRRRPRSRPRRRHRPRRARTSRRERHPRSAAADLRARPARPRRRRCPGARRPAASPRGRPRTSRGGRGGRASRLSSTAASGANATVSSSWNDDASQTTSRPGRASPASDVSAVPTLPATATGSPASRWMWPISSVVVVLPFEPVTAMNSLGSSRQASSSSPTTGSPRSRAARDDRRLLRHARALDERPRRRRAARAPSVARAPRPRRASSSPIAAASTRPRRSR